jgi:iron complex transport system substrate-binding protein
MMKKTEYRRQNTESAFAEASADRYRMRIFIILLLGAASALVIFSCKTKKSAQATVPERIITLSPNITEIAFALGLGEKIVAVSSDSDWPPQAREKTKVGSFWQPNIETIIAAKPDLVITEKSEHQDTISNNLERLGYKVLNLNIGKIEDLFTAIQKVGEAAGCQQDSEKIAKNIENQLNDLKVKYASTDKVRVLWVVQPDPLRVAGRNTFINEMIEITGGENAIGPTLQQYPPLGGEELLACGAEVIIQSAMGAGNIDEQQKAAKLFWSKFANLPAVINNKVFVINADTVLRLGPRLPEGAKLIADCLHPKTSEKDSSQKEQ